MPERSGCKAQEPVLPGSVVKVKSNTGMNRADDLCTMEALHTLVLGASPDPSRYANMAIRRLRSKGVPVVAVGARKGEVDGVPIVQEIPAAVRIHTVTMYMNPMVQEAWHERILDLRPERIIFNPGTEHEGFAQRAKAMGIATVEGCTLVMLGTGQY